MKTWVKVLVWIGGVLAVVVLVVVVGGMLLPEAHTAARTAMIEQPADAVWSLITDYGSAPEWRSNVARVEKREREGQEIWVEYDESGEAIPYATVASEPPRRLVREIASDRLPFGGTWTFDLEPEGTGTRLTITENGTVSNPVFRFVSKFLIGHASFMEDYLSSLGRHFGQDVEIRDPRDG